MTYHILFICIPNLCYALPTTEWQIFFFFSYLLYSLTNILPHQSIIVQWQWHQSPPHNLYCLQNLLADSLLCFWRTMFLFHSSTFIFYLYFDFFILTLLIFEGFWTRWPTVHNTIWEGHWFTVDHCWLRK